MRERGVDEGRQAVVCCKGAEKPEEVLGLKKAL